MRCLTSRYISVGSTADTTKPKFDKLCKLNRLIANIPMTVFNFPLKSNQIIFFSLGLHGTDHEYYIGKVRSHLQNSIKLTLKKLIGQIRIRIILFSLFYSV